MIVPTQVSNASLLGATGRTPLATPTDFGADVGVATLRLGGQIGQSTAQLAAVKENKARLDGARWINESMTRLRDHFSKWMADPANLTKETFDEDLRTQLQKSGDDYEAAAPDKLTATHFREIYNNFASTRYDSAVNTSAQTRLGNTVQSFSTSADALMQQYRTDRGSLVDANVNFINGISQQRDLINATVKPLSPKVAAQLDDQLMTSAVYTAMDENPALARKLLDRSNVDGHQRHIMQNAINSAEESHRAVNAEVFNEMQRNMEAMLLAGVDQPHITKDQVSPYFKSSQVDAVVDRWNRKVDVGNAANAFTRKISPMSPRAQAKELGELQESIAKDPAKAGERADELQLVYQKTLKNIEEAQKNPAGYIMRHNPSVASAASRYASALTGQNQVEKMQARGELNNLLLKYEGAPPEGADVAEAAKYHNVNRDQLSLLDDAEAEATAGQINQGSPQEALDRINAIMSVNGNESHQAIIMSDLMRLPEGKRLRGEYWVAYMNRNQPWVKDFLGAIKAPGATKEVSPDVEAHFTKELNTNPDWMAFVSSMPGDNFQRQGIAADVKNGIMLYAQALATRSGKGPGAMVDYAAGQVLNSVMRPISVNGHRQVMQRDKGDGKMMSDGQLREEADNLRLALSYINPADVNLEDQRGNAVFAFPAGATDELKRQMIRDTIKAKGFAVPSADGKSISFYVSNGLQSPVELRDKSGAAFEVRRLELPDLTMRVMLPIWTPVGVMMPKVKLARFLPDPLAPTSERVVDAQGNVVTFDKIPSLSEFQDRGLGVEQVYPPTPDWLRRRGGKKAVPEAVPVKFDEGGGQISMPDDRQ